MTPRAEIAMLTERIARGKGRPGDAGRLAYLERRVNSATEMPGGCTGAARWTTHSLRAYPTPADESAE